MKRLTALVASFALVAAVTPVSVAAAGPLATGGIRGAVIQNTGRPLSTALRVQLVNNRGVAVPGKSAAVAADGAYSLANVEPGIYTIQVLGAAGSAAVSVVAGRVSTANVTVATPTPRQGMSTTAKWVIALAAIGGGGAIVALIATRKKASGSQ